MAIRHRRHAAPHTSSRSAGASAARGKQRSLSRQPRRVCAIFALSRITRTPLRAPRDSILFVECARAAAPSAVFCRGSFDGDAHLRIRLRVSPAFLFIAVARLRWRNDAAARLRRTDIKRCAARAITLRASSIARGQWQTGQHRHQRASFVGDNRYAPPSLRCCGRAPRAHSIAGITRAASANSGSALANGRRSGASVPAGRGVSSISTQRHVRRAVACAHNAAHAALRTVVSCRGTRRISILLVRHVVRCFFSSLQVCWRSSSIAKA